MGPMVASTLKLGIAILNGGNSVVQQVMLSNGQLILCLDFDSVKVTVFNCVQKAGDCAFDFKL